MIDIVQVVNILELNGLLRPVNQLQDWYRCYCPIHSNGQERRPSFGISLRDQYRGGSKYPAGFAHCFTCSYAANLEDFVSKLLELHNIEQSGREWLSEHVPGYESNPDFDYLIPSDMMDVISSKFAVNKLQDMLNPKQEYVSEEELASYRFTVPYMYERKLTDEIIEKYDIGYDANWIPDGRSKPVPCITFPVRDRDGHTLYFCRRSIQGKLYHYPKGVTKSVFGIDVIPKGVSSIIICESCINALTAEVYGYNAVAVLGTGNSYQIQQLKELGVREFVLCFDGDDAGRRATKKFKNALKSVAIVWEVTMPEGKDLNDCTKQEFDLLYSQRN